MTGQQRCRRFTRRMGLCGSPLAEGVCPNAANHANRQVVPSAREVDGK